MRGPDAGMSQGHPCLADNVGFVEQPTQDLMKKSKEL